MAESITIIDNRTGNQLEIPIRNGGVEAGEWSKLLPGIWFYDPGFTATAACESSVSVRRRRRRDPALPRLRHRRAGRELQLPRGRLSPAAREPAHRGRVRRMAPRDHVPHLHPRERTEAFPRGVPLRRPSHGDARLGGRRAVDLLPRRQGHLQRRGQASPDHPAHRQDAHAGRRRPPVLGRDALRLSRQFPRLRRELPLDDVEGGRTPVRRQPHPGPGPRHPVHPPCRPRAELLDHRHARGGVFARRPLLVLRGRLCRALRSPPRRGQRDGHPHAHRDRLDRERARVHRLGQAGRRGSAPGLRPPGLQELRPPGPDHQADRRRGVRHHRQEPAARHRPEARGDRPLRRVLHVPSSLSQRGLLLRPHLPGHGVPARDVPGALRHPAHRRVVGALGGDARPGLQDRPSPPALHRRGAPPVRPHHRR